MKAALPGRKAGTKQRELMGLLGLMEAQLQPKVWPKWVLSAGLTTLGNV